jgi:probable rRNA maturation factor
MRVVTIHNGHPGLRPDRRAAVALIRALDAHAGKFLGGCPPGELSLAFLTDAGLARLHGDFLADPGITDVITFAGHPAYGLAGEICVSADAAARQVYPERSRRTCAERSRRTYPGGSRTTKASKNNFSDELTLYIVHGWLHLAGYDDLSPGEKRKMRSAEARALKLLRAAGHRPRFRLGRAFKLASPGVKKQHGPPQGAAAFSPCLPLKRRADPFWTSPSGLGREPVPGGVGREGQGFSPTVRVRRDFALVAARPAPAAPQRRTMPV